MSARYLKLTDVAERLSTSPETVRYWTSIGKLKAYKPGRQLLIREDDLEAFVAASSIGALREAKAKRARKKAA
jgi:excisionase family DNA binding protein